MRFLIGLKVVNTFVRLSGFAVRSCQWEGPLNGGCFFKLFCFLRGLSQLFKFLHAQGGQLVNVVLRNKTVVVARNGSLDQTTCYETWPAFGQWPWTICFRVS